MSKTTREDIIGFSLCAFLFGFLVLINALM